MNNIHHLDVYKCNRDVVLYREEQILRTFLSDIHSLLLQWLSANTLLKIFFKYIFNLYLYICIFKKICLNKSLPYWELNEYGISLFDHFLYGCRIEFRANLFSSCINFLKFGIAISPSVFLPNVGSSATSIPNFRKSTSVVSEALKKSTNESETSRSSFVLSTT